MLVPEVYSYFKTPKNLQTHMLQVSALAKLILDHWTGQPVDSEAVLHTCLFHDLAKPITFDMANQASFVKSAKELELLRRHHYDLQSRFGSDEHAAVISMFREVGLSSKAQRLVDKLEWSYVDQLIEQNEFEALIPIYCDMRISPKGIILIHDRVQELNTRTPVADLETRLSSAERLENIIKQNTSLDLDTLSNDQIDLNLTALNEMKVG